MNGSKQRYKVIGEGTEGSGCCETVLSYKTMKSSHFYRRILFL